MLIFGMLTAIEFNYQFGFQAGKVGQTINYKMWCCQFYYR